MSKVVDEIRNHRSTVLDNNEIMIEMLTQMVEPNIIRNNYVLSVLREQNRLLKIIINELRDKLRASNNDN
tara:strand:+ start:180 stop:389 length:210 start_codon:yes stop_codon:yes gene_type:complete